MKIPEIFYFVWDTFLSIFAAQKRHASKVDSYPLTGWELSKKMWSLDGTSVVTLLDYQQKEVQALIRALKYENSRRAAKILGGILGTYLESLRPFEMQTRIIAMPLHRKRLLERGYNQVERVLTAISWSTMRKTNLIICRDMLRRTKNTPQQTRLTKEDRAKNMEEAFSVEKTYDDEVVILVDDVFTTGATLLAAREKILKSGVKEVICISLARA